jgi:hypothetical protein
MQKMKDSKFMIVQDQATADKLKAAGFQLISDNNGLCVFVNTPPRNFNFDEVDLVKIGFTNILSI